MKNNIYNIIQEINFKFQSYFEIKKKYKILIGISGGVDSAVLLSLINTFALSRNIEIIAAHFIHEWEFLGEEFIKEEKVMKEWAIKFCKELNIKLIIDSKNYAEEEKINNVGSSKEGLGRIKRIAFFEKIKKEERIDFVFLGHHQDDQIENFFIKLIRGSSLEGLSGIKEKKDFYIRPFLKIKKKNILAIANELKIKYCNDSGNTNTMFLRNRIRANLIPLYEKIDNRFEKNILHTINRMDEVSSFIAKYTDQIYLKIYNKEERKIDKILFLKEHLTIQKKIFFLILYDIKFTKYIKESLFNEFLKHIQTKNNIPHIISGKIIIEKIDRFIYLKNKT